MNIIRKRFNTKFIVKIIFIVSVLIISACSESSNSKENDELVSPSLNVALNEGEKWEANAETTEGVENMKTVINKFDKTSKIDGYKKLSEDLEVEFTMIFQKCTMKGEAHNQLHSYLIPLKDYIEGLQKGNVEECKSIVNSINSHLSGYKYYFQ